MKESKKMIKKIYRYIKLLIKNRQYPYEKPDIESLIYAAETLTAYVWDTVNQDAMSIPHSVDVSLQTLADLIDYEVSKK